MNKKKIISIIGARPQIIKSSAISRAIRTKFQNEIEELIVHTGQHYDENMSEVFFEELQIPKPHFNLNVGSGSHGVQTAKMIEGLENIFLSEKPDAIVVYGDTNSTIAGGLAAAKIHIPIVHIEAGLRSFNKAMPEELNRIACDHFSTLLFTPTAIGLENLRKEGFSTTINSKATIDQPNVYQCGDIMFDNSMYFSEISDEKSTVLKLNDLEKDNYVLCTIHRDSNTDIAANLNSIFNALIHISESKNLKIVLPIHPRTKGKMEELLDKELIQKLTESGSILIIPPAGFLDIIALEKNARVIISDSGGLQKESFFFQKPCVILREQTEWVEIVENGNALLAGSNFEKIIDSFNLLYNKTNYSFPAFYGDGDAASFICQKIVEDL
jgi:UDP-GlcNAc3NAcA epimerase